MADTMDILNTKNAIWDAKWLTLLVIVDKYNGKVQRYMYYN